MVWTVDDSSPRTGHITTLSKFRVLFNALEEAYWLLLRNLNYQCGVVESGAPSGSPRREAFYRGLPWSQGG